MPLRPIAFAFALLAASCSSERKIYGTDGKEVQDREAGANSSLEERFTGSFDVKKNKDGVPEASSGRVSSFQSQIDEARESGQGDVTGMAGKKFGGREEIGDLREQDYQGSATRFGGGKSYADSDRTAYTPDNVPDFLKPGKGITRKEFARGGESSSAGRSYSTGEELSRVLSPTSTDKTSGYFESRRDKTPPPVIMSRDEYQRMTLEESRGLLGRDKSQ